MRKEVCRSMRIVWVRIMRSIRRVWNKWRPGDERHGKNVEDGEAKLGRERVKIFLSHIR